MELCLFNYQGIGFSQPVCTYLGTVADTEREGRAGGGGGVVVVCIRVK